MDPRWLLLPFAYLLGGVPFGLYIGRRCGVDVRSTGSGNIGATNVWRTCGARAGLAALGCDILKGVLPTVLALALARGDDYATLHVLTGACAVLGHSFSPFLGFKGGKGVATSLGVALALVPLPALVALIVFLITVGLTRYVSLGSLLGALALGIATEVLHLPVIYRVVAWVMVALIWVRHRANLGRLLRGEESRFTLKGRSAKAEAEGGEG